MPDLSVIVPTSGRPDAIVRLAQGLARQTFPADRFEVIVTDDGSDPPVAKILEQLDLPYALHCEWQPRRGPAAARNRAISKASGRVLLILNDDAGAPPDLLARHWKAQESHPEPRAWLGGFDFAPECRTPFALAATKLGVVFPYYDMKKEGPNPGRFFWTCNLSVPRQPVLDAGGFDETFTRPICEDVELGYRLEKRGVMVHWLEDSPCLHHHRVDADWFMKRQIELGIGIVKLWRKHQDPELMPWIKSTRGDANVLQLALERDVVARGRVFEQLVRRIDVLDASERTTVLDPVRAEERARAAAEIEPFVKRVHADALKVGLYAGLKGLDQAEVWDWLAKLPNLTTLVVPPERIGSAGRTWVERVRLLAGAPVEIVELAPPPPGSSTRHSLLERARGEHLCFLDASFDPRSGWLREILQNPPKEALSFPGRFRLVRRATLAESIALRA